MPVFPLPFGCRRSLLEHPIPAGGTGPSLRLGYRTQVHARTPTVVTTLRTIETRPGWVPPPLDVNPDASNPTVVVTHVRAGTGHWTLARSYAVDITSTSHQRVHSHRVRSDRGALLVLPPVGFPGPPPEPGVPITEHRALHKPRQGFRRALRTSRPRCWDACSPVVVALDADSGRIEQHHVTVGRPTVSSAVTASEVPPGTARMLAPLPPHEPFP